MFHATVVGARGYLGRELVRLLVQHPDIDQVTPVSTTEAGQPYRDHVPGFGRVGLSFHASDSSEALAGDVVFLATPHGAAASAAAAHEAAGAKVVIDLSRDHRLGALDGTNGWHYGLPELFPTPAGTASIANPGCYPTAAALAMAPAVRAGVVGDGPIIVDGKSGVSGAGVAVRSDLQFAEMNESVRAYKVLGHDHVPEMAAAAGLLNGSKHRVRFTPHLVPQTRGLLCTVYLPANTSDATAVFEAYAQHYADTQFVDVVPEADTGHVRGTQRAEVAVDLDVDTGLIIARCAIDNLCRGGAGNAVANMNDALGLGAGAGLPMLGANV